MRLVFLVVASAVAVPARAEPPLKLTPLTLTLGGGLGVSSSYAGRLDEPGSQRAFVGGVLFDVRPAAGLFVAEGLELSVRPTFVTLLSDQLPTFTILGLSLGLTYYARWNSVYIYSGLSPFIEARWEAGRTTLAGGVSIPAGIALPCNKHLAIDLGFRVKLAFSGNVFAVEVPVGYFGLLAFL